MPHHKPASAGQLRIIWAPQRPMYATIDSSHARALGGREHDATKPQSALTYREQNAYITGLIASYCPSTALIRTLSAMHAIQTKTLPRDVPTHTHARFQVPNDVNFTCAQAPYLPIATPTPNPPRSVRINSADQLFGAHQPYNIQAQRTDERPACGWEIETSPSISGSKAAICYIGKVVGLCASFSFLHIFFVSGSALFGSRNWCIEYMASHSIEHRIDHVWGMTKVPYRLDL